MRMAMVVGLLLLALSAHALAPRAISWADGQATYLAALADGRLRLAQVVTSATQELATLPAPGITTLAVGRWQGKPVVLGARGSRLLRLNLTSRSWVTLGTFPSPIRQLLPARDATPAALVLTGGSGAPVPRDGAVWWVHWARRFRRTRLVAVKPNFRPWQLWWTRMGTVPCFAAATYKSTTFAPFAHNCMFLFRWRHGTAEARWLGSRLNRPYVDATHAPLGAYGVWRMVSVEVTKDGGRGLSVYHAIDFGYEGEWRSEAMPGLERVAAYGDAVLAWGHDPGTGRPCAWWVLTAETGYRLQPCPKAPPAPEAATRVTGTRMIGWWDGHWHLSPLCSE